MELPGWLQASLVLLSAAVVAVTLSRALGLGSVIGYLVAGMAIGPWGLRLMTDPAAILDFAQFGVVLMLFLVGLELQPRRLWAMRHTIFLRGTVQVVASSAALALLGRALGLGAATAIVLGIALAMSSTAIGVSVLAERNLATRPSGQGVLGVSLFQDLSALPVLAMIPLLAALTGAAAPTGSASAGWLLAPEWWDRTGRNLHRALLAGIGIDGPNWLADSSWAIWAIIGVARENPGRSGKSKRRLVFPHNRRRGT